MNEAVFGITDPSRLETRREPTHGGTMTHAEASLPRVTCSDQQRPDDDRAMHAPTTSNDPTAQSPR